MLKINVVIPYQYPNPESSVPLYTARVNQFLIVAMCFILLVVTVYRRRRQIIADCILMSNSFSYIRAAAAVDLLAY